MNKIKQRRRAPWKLQWCEIENFYEVYKRPLVYKITPSLRHRNLKYILCEVRTNTRDALYLKRLHILESRILRYRTFHSKKRIWSNWQCAVKNDQTGRFYKAMDTFHEIYLDRDERYDLYFTQGITDPFGPEANMFLSLTRDYYML